MIAKGSGKLSTLINMRVKRTFKAQITFYQFYKACKENLNIKVKSIKLIFISMKSSINYSCI